MLVYFLNINVLIDSFYFIQALVTVLSMKLFEPSTFLCDVFNKNLNPFKEKFSNVMFNRIISQSPFLVDIVNSIKVSNINIEKRKYAFPLDLCKINKKKRSAGDIFTNLNLSCDINNQDYNLNFCWQEFEIEYEVNFKISCSNFSISTECEAYFNNDNSNLTVSGKIKDLIVDKLATFNNLTLIQSSIIYNAISRDDDLTFNVDFVGKKCNLTANDFTNCIELEKKRIENDTKEDILRVPSFYTEKCQIFSKKCIQNTNQICVEGILGPTCKCRNGLINDTNCDGIY
jgi:hypothetical protein